MNKQKDPVCGASIDPANCPNKTQFNSKQYYFCCNKCLESFKENPNKFAK